MIIPVRNVALRSYLLNHDYFWEARLKEVQVDREVFEFRRTERSIIFLHF